MASFSLLLFLSVTRMFAVKVGRVEKITIQWVALPPFVQPVLVVKPNAIYNEITGENKEESGAILDRITKVNNLNMELKKSEVAINELNDVIVHEGDIIVNKSWCNNSGSQNDKRATYHHYAHLWHSKILPYEIDLNMPSATVHLVEMALADIQVKTCLKFRRRTRERDWIRFTRQRGCWSSVGLQAIGAQNISIGTGCDVLGIVQHEVMHALGFFHEQSRPDRDMHVSIYWENILPGQRKTNTLPVNSNKTGTIPSGQEGNFFRYSKQAITTLDLQYDYESVLHYGNAFFSKNGRPTIVATKTPWITLGQRHGMSKLDYARINVLYDCKFHQADAWSQWSQFSPCDELCRKKRQRFCYSEHPGNCDKTSPSGLQTDIVQCPYEECYAPIDGHWSRWSRFTACSTSCGIGFHRRVRLCNDPYPAYGGNGCVGESWELKNCRIRLCNLGRHDCDFTDGTCGWVQSSFDDFDWTRKSEGTPSMNTGPDWDHTGVLKGVEESYGHFMYIEATGKPPGYRARLESPMFHHFDAGENISKCLSFYYHMFGSSMGRLNVYLVFADGQNEQLWQKSGDQGKAWNHGMITFTPFSTYKIVFEGTRGTDYTSDLAIDDIKVVHQKCPQKSRRKGDTSTITRVSATALSKLLPSSTNFAGRIPTSVSNPVTITTTLYTNRDKITIKHFATIEKTSRRQVTFSAEVKSTVFASPSFVAQSKSRILTTN